MQTKKILNPDHELDLEYIEKFGYIDNNEIRLSETDFITEENVQKCFDIYSSTFLLINLENDKKEK